jgi:uncharacterized membrane protein
MESSNNKNTRRAKIVFVIERVFGVLAFIALLCAWITQVTGGSIMGMNQQHFFFDSIALSLVSIGYLLNGLLYSKNLM